MFLGHGLRLSCGHSSVQSPLLRHGFVPVRSSCISSHRFLYWSFPDSLFFLNEPIKPYVLKMCYTFVHQIIFPGSCILSVRTLRKKNKFQLLGISYKFVTIYFLYYRVETLPNDSNCTCIGFQPFGKKKCTCTY